MSLFVKIILIIFAFAYFISPIDIIPDFLIPFVGWIDDTFIIGVIIYLIRYGKLPNFSGRNYKFFNIFSNLFNSSKNQTSNDYQTYKSTNKSRRDQYYNGIKQDPYEILGINKNATKEEIQAAYKHKVKQYHPDKVSHLGEELQKIANEKFIEIKNAYDLLMK